MQMHKFPYRFIPHNNNLVCWGPRDHPQVQCFARLTRLRWQWYEERDLLEQSLQSDISKGKSTRGDV